MSLWLFRQAEVTEHQSFELSLERRRGFASSQIAKLGGLDPIIVGCGHWQLMSFDATIRNT